MYRPYPYGYYLNGDYIGYMPDGSKMKFPSESEYEEYFNDILEEDEEEEEKK